MKKIIYIFVLLVLFFLNPYKTKALDLIINNSCLGCEKCYISESDYALLNGTCQTGQGTTCYIINFNTADSRLYKKVGNTIYVNVKTGENQFGEKPVTNNATLLRYITFQCYNSNSTGPSGGDWDVSLGNELSCDDILGDNGVLLVKTGITILRILAPLILVLLSVNEFLKAIPSQDAEIVKKAWNKFGTRCIITALIMLLPTFLNLIGQLTSVFDNCNIW